MSEEKISVTRLEGMSNVELVNEVYRLFRQTEPEVDPAFAFALGYALGRLSEAPDKGEETRRRVDSAKIPGGV